MMVQRLKDALEDEKYEDLLVDLPLMIFLEEEKTLSGKTFLLSKQHSLKAFASTVVSSFISQSILDFTAPPYVNTSCVHSSKGERRECCGQHCPSADNGEGGADKQEP